MHLAVFSGDRTVFLQDDGRVMVQARGTLLEKGKHQDNTQFFRQAPKISVDGPGIVSAKSNILVSSVWQKYSRYAVLARRPIPLPPGQLYGYLPLASLYSPLYQRYSFVVLILLSYLIGCSCYSIKPSGYCIVTQCREPCCLISGRQLMPMISRSGNASRKAALAISSFGES